MNEPVIPQSSSLTDGDAKMDAPSDHRPFKKPRHSMRPSNSGRQSFTSYGMHLPAEHSTAVVPSSEPCTDPADDATVSTLLSESIDTLNATPCNTFMTTLNDTLKAPLSDAFKAKTAAHEAAMDWHTVAWKGAVIRAKYCANGVEQKLKTRESNNLALISSKTPCLHQLANERLAAEQSARHAHALNSSSKNERLAKLHSDRLATTNCAWPANLIINDITILKHQKSRT